MSDVLNIRCYSFLEKDHVTVSEICLFHFVHVVLCNLIPPPLIEHVVCYANIICTVKCLFIDKFNMHSNV